MSLAHRAVSLQVDCMWRRHFLGVMGGATLTACVPAPPTTVMRTAGSSSRGVRAVAFDLFTLFDPRGVDKRVTQVIGDNPAFTATWKMKLFEYSWLRAASSQYRDFQGLVQDALLYATRSHNVELSPTARAQLEASFVELEAWPDSKDALRSLRGRGLKLAPLANFSPTMIRTLLARANLIEEFDDLISTDRARSYKPDPRAYGLAETSFGLPRSQIAFAAFGSWDAAGGCWFGFPTFWVNRFSQPDEELGARGASGPDLAHLLRWIETLGIPSASTKRWPSTP
jgi:2-haloacid dehalogenase